MGSRRTFLERFSRLGAGVLAASAVAATTSEAQAQTQSTSQAPGKLKIMMKSAWGSDDPTRASFPFVHGLALAEAGHEVRIFLIGEGTFSILMRKATADAIMPVGWPPLSQTREKLLAKHIPVFA